MLARSAQSRSDKAKNLVGFSVGGASYAVDIHRVREIINPLVLAPLPNAPAAVVGMADHRGVVVPVIDLRERFGSKDVGTGRSKWVLVNGPEGVVGLVVDAVTDVFAATDDDHGSLPPLARSDEDRGIAYVCRRKEGLVFVIDVARVVAPAQDVRRTASGREAPR